MTEFYLFDVNHGQCAGLRLPNSRWCVFDVGKNCSFSPVSWMINEATAGVGDGLDRLVAATGFQFLKATISHLHGDHVSEWQALLAHGPEFLKTIDFDSGYLDDVATTSTSDSLSNIHGFCRTYATRFSPARDIPDYGGVTISELCLPVGVVRALGGDANSRVNNASVVSRITAHGNSILLCGDVEAEAWTFALGNNVTGPAWRNLVQNVDVLVAPHHGHASGFSVELMRLARPKVVLVSIVSQDEHIDCRYSAPEFASGITIGDTPYRCITTRQQGHIKLAIKPAIPRANDLGSFLATLSTQGSRSWTFGPPAIGLARPKVNPALLALLSLGARK